MAQFSGANFRFFTNVGAQAIQLAGNPTNVSAPGSMAFLLLSICCFVCAKRARLKRNND